MLLYVDASGLREVNNDACDKEIKSCDINHCITEGLRS